MKLKELASRWLLVTFPPRSPEKKQARQTAMLWRKLQKASPRWYDPVSDILSPEFCLTVLDLQVNAERVAASLGLSGKKSVPPSLMPELVGRLTDCYLEKSKSSRQSLGFGHILEEAAAQGDVNYRQINTTLHTRVAEILKGDHARWESGLPYLEALVHLVCFDWEPLSGLSLSGKGKKVRNPGTAFVDGLEDLVFLLEPLVVNAGLLFLYRILTGTDGDSSLEALGKARKSLMEEGRLLDIIRAIKSDPDHAFRRAVYQPPTITQAIREITLDFEADLKKHQMEYEQAQLASLLHTIFGDRKLEDFPIYNLATSSQLVQKKLPELSYVRVINLSFNFCQWYHQQFFQRFFQDFAMKAEFTNAVVKSEHNTCVDEYLRFVTGLEKFATDLQSPSFSPMGPVMAAMQQPFFDSRTKIELRKHIEATNAWADQLCQHALQAFGALYRLLLKYVKDLELPVPASIAGIATLAADNPELIQDLKKAAVLLRGMARILKQMVANLSGTRDVAENP